MPSEPLMNCVSLVPIKNLSVLTSNKPPFAVVNIKCRSSLSPTICIPTPVRTSSPSCRLPEPEYITNPPGPFPNDADVCPLNPTERINPDDTPPISIPLPIVSDMNIEPLIRLLPPPIYVLPPWNTKGSVIVSVLEISPIEFKY